jgi:fructokinase
MLNTAVSLGRAGIKVELISEIAEDRSGEMIINFLHENQVSTNFIHHYSDGKTAISLAFLNERSDAVYSFYTDPPKERLSRKLPVPTSEDIILFGSFFSLTDGIHEKLIDLLKLAIQNNTIIFYDPNFRNPHLKDLNLVMHRIIENISFADIIRGSDEDFLHIFASRNPGEAYERVRSHDRQVLIYTQSKEVVSIITEKYQGKVRVPKIEPISTIGAGDSFNAGLIHALITMGISRKTIPFLDMGDWEKIVRNAIRFAQNVCMSLDNYISYDFLISFEK